MGLLLSDIIQPLAQYLDLHVLVALRRVSRDLYVSSHLSTVIKQQKKKVFGEIPEKFWNKSTKDEEYVEMIGQHYVNDVNYCKGHFVMFDLRNHLLVVFSTKDKFEAHCDVILSHLQQSGRKTVYRTLNGFRSYQTRLNSIFITS